MVSVELLKSYPEFTLDVSWQAEGGVIALFGPSGSGKTLTLQCLAGLVRPEGGRVTVGGRVLFDALRAIHQPPRDRRLGVVFQGYALFPHLTVEQNIAFGLESFPRRFRRARTEELLARLGLEEIRRRRPPALSGGQQQRVALGRALATDPDLILLDEPLAALDRPLRRALLEDLHAALRGFGKTAVLVTHDLSEACQLADHLVVYDRGRVLQSGSRADVLARPASPSVAAVLGIRNVLRGTVLEATRTFVRLLWRDHELWAANRAAAPDLPVAGSEVSFFIRPEHVRLMRKDRAGAAGERRLNLLAGEVVGETDLGAVLRLQFRVGGAGGTGGLHHDLEIEISRLSHEKLCVHYDRRWAVSIQPSAVQLLPETVEAVLPESAGPRRFPAPRRHSDRHSVAYRTGAR